MKIKLWFLALACCASGFLYAADENQGKRVVGMVIQECNRMDFGTRIGQDAGPLIDFLYAADELNLDVQSVYTGLRILYNNMKRCELFDTSVVNHFFTIAPRVLPRYFNTATDTARRIEALRTAIERTIVFKITDNFDHFRSDTNGFLSMLSQELAMVSEKELMGQSKNTEDFWRERLRTKTIDLCELLINKSLWNTSAYESICPAVMQTAHGIYGLAQGKVINHMDDFDDLMWSLTHRLCYFLDLTGTSLPVSFYEQVEQEVGLGSAFFLELDEQDEGVMSKKQALMHTLHINKIKAMTQERTSLIVNPEEIPG